ncbi:DNA internalization-related competence protein ComEC/Rec2 [Streptococcus cameli]
MKKWLNKTPIPPIQLAVVMLSIYFLIYRFSILGLLFLGFLLWRMFGQYGRDVFRKNMLVLLLGTVVFVGHRTLEYWREHQQPSNLTRLQVVPDTISVNGDSLSFQAKEAGFRYQVFYKLQSQEEQAYFQNMVDLVVLEVEAEVTIPEGQRNFNGFDYRQYLRTKGIYRTVNIKRITSVKKAISWNPLDWLASMRRKALVHVRTQFPAPMRHYMTGLLFGDLDKEFEEMEDVYSSLGIIHLFALSGMQVGFFIDKFRYLLLRLGLKRETVDWLQLPFSLVYAGLTGWSVSVVRSLVQKLVGNKQIKGLNNLAVTLGICYLISPAFLLSSGGVLSFSYAFLLTVFDFEHLSSIWKTVVESVAISLGILPILIYYFSGFQPLSILLTFLFSFVFDVLLLPLLSLVFLLSPVLIIDQFNSLFQGLERIISWVASISSQPLVFGKPSLVLLVLLLIFLAILYDFWSRKPIVLLFSIMVLALLFFVKHPLENEVTVVDIGQGDSLFLRDMSGKTMLIDVGGRVNFSSGESWREKRTDANAERTLIPYLKSRGVGKIDQLVLTHTDTDHIGDMEVVAKHVVIGEVLVSPGSLTVPEFVERLKAMKVKVRVLKAGDSLSMMGSQLHVLYPWETGDGGNNDSLVLYGRLLDKNFLLTGDLEDGELELIERYPSLPVDVLKAGHHGSKGSSYPEFLDHIQPQISLISAGKNNRYKHPHQETLDRFKERDIAVYRTDQQGAIRFRGLNKWTVETVR